MRLDVRDRSAIDLTAKGGRRVRPPLVLASAAVVVAVIAATLALVLMPGTAHGANFTVDSEFDDGDADPGDGVCAAPFGQCSLRTAIEEANALPGDDIITVPAGTFTLIDVLEISGTDKLTIVGAGAGNTIIDGGGFVRVFEVLSFATLEISSLLIANGSSGNGGGIFIASGGTLAMSNGTVAGNRADRGGGIRNNGSLTLTNSTVSGNTATRDGGGLVNGSSATATLTNVTVSGNTAMEGGGIWNFIGTVTLTGSTVRDNEATGGNGGGLLNARPSSVGRSSLTLTNSTVSGNTTTGAGGMFNGSYATATLNNTTISGNNATNDGGGIANAAAGLLTVLNSTINGNIAGGGGGGIQHIGESATLKNSIVAGNTGGNCVGAVLSLDNNLASDETCNLVPPGDLPGVDPLLGPLANNGGPTQTHALLPDSPAIDAGDDGAAPATDQRGLPRVGTSDIGAFELQGVDADGDGFDDIAGGGTDCEDTDATIFPGATEVPYDSIDQDCDGSDLTDVDGDGVAADQAVGGTPDCDDTDASVFPGATEISDDGIDQDCDGEDAIGGPEAVPTVTFSLIGGFNALVFPGADGTPIADVATAIGSITDAIFRFDADTQSWLVYRPEVVVPGLNTLATANQRDVLLVRLAAGGVATLTWDDALSAEPVRVALLPGFTFVGFSGGDGTALADLLAMLPAGVDAAFRYEAPIQAYGVFRRSQPSFLSTFTSADRLDALFIRNTTPSTSVLSWEQVAAGGP